MSADLKKDILEAKRRYKRLNCKCIRTKHKDEYWGYWLECECGYKNNTTSATYCGGCGRKIHITGTTNHCRSAMTIDIVDFGKPTPMR